MGKQSKPRKSENIGKGKVTPVQIAFIVDRYLSDNNFTQTRSTFRNEASDLISKSPVQEAPKSLLSLGAMLDEYICLKEHKVFLDQEKCRLEHEKFRVQNLLRGMQDVMNLYNVGEIVNPPPTALSSMPKTAAVVPQIDQAIVSSAGLPMFSTPVVVSTSRASNTNTDTPNFSTPITHHTISARKRGLKDVSDAAVPAKRSRSRKSTGQLPVTGSVPLPSNAANTRETALQFSAVQSSPNDNVTNGSPIQGSSVAKCLFNQSTKSFPTNSSGPKTPPRATSSQAEKSVSPVEISSTATSSKDVTPQLVASTNYMVISSETIKVSPVKHISCYTIEKNHCISTSSPVKTTFKRLSKRDNVKGRLDFDVPDMPMNSEKPLSDGISVSESDKEADVFDMDLPNLDALGVDFSFSDLLVDFDFGGEGINYSFEQAMDSSPDSLTGSPDVLGNDSMGANKVMSEFSSTVTEILSEKDMNVPGPDSMTSVKSITKCIKILSPVKYHTSPSNQENLLTRN
ncbi:unnamed protein product [Ilex paraguariensis]|uniref:LisH domain-containing protein n=1 Tax=Ilex paraguariensis TaxID=185542 RepID=A0ABC8UFJ9_9AQUA